MASRNKYFRQWSPLDSRAETVSGEELLVKDPDDYLSRLPLEHYEAALHLLFCRNSVDLVSYEMATLDASLAWLLANEEVRFAAHFKPSLSDRRRKFMLCLALPLLFAMVLTVFQNVVQLLGGYYYYYWSAQSWAGTVAQILLWLAAVFVLLCVWADYPLDCSGSCVLTNLRVIRIYDVGDYLLSPSTESYWYSAMWLRSLTLNFLPRDWFYSRQDRREEIRPLSLRFSLLGNLRGFAKITPSPRLLRELCRTFLSEVRRIEVPSFHLVAEIDVDDTDWSKVGRPGALDDHNEDDVEQSAYGLFTTAEWAEVQLLLSRCRTNRWLTDFLFGCLFVPWMLLFLVTFLERDVLQFFVGNAISLFFLYISSCLITLRFIGSAHRARRSEVLDQVLQALNYKYRHRGLEFVSSMAHASQLIVRIYQVVEPLGTTIHPSEEQTVEYFEIPYTSSDEEQRL